MSTIPKTRQPLRMAQFAAHRLNHGASTIKKIDATGQPFQGEPPAFVKFNAERRAAHVDAATRTTAAGELRKRQAKLDESLKAIAKVLGSDTIRKLDGYQPTGGLGDLLRARVAAPKGKK